MIPLHASLVGCGARVNETSTNTGNPPWIDGSLVRVTASGEPNKVTITADPGAVPTETTVKVTNVDTGETVVLVSEGDGGFTTQLEGDQEDTYSVRVGSESISIQSLAQVPSSTPGPDASVGLNCGEGLDLEARERRSSGPLTCEFDYATAECEGSRALAEATAACSVDDDCEVVASRPSCNIACLGETALNHAGAIALSARLAEINDQVCTAFDDGGCSVIEPPCIPFEPIAICLSQRCQVTQSAVLDQNDALLTCSDGVAGASGHPIPAIPYVDEDGTQPPPPVPNPDARCDAFENEAHCRIEAELASLDNSCSDAMDCDAVEVPLSCAFNDCQGPLPVAGRNLDHMRAFVEQVETDLCEPAVDFGCEFPWGACTQGTALTVECIESQCVAVYQDGNISDG